MRDLTRQLERRLQDFAKEEAGAAPSAGRAAVAIMVREGVEATEMLIGISCRFVSPRLVAVTTTSSKASVASAALAVCELSKPRHKLPSVVAYFNFLLVFIVILRL